jgi:sulfate permease, SulP family
VSCPLLVRLGPADDQHGRGLRVWLTRHGRSRAVNPLAGLYAYLFGTIGSSLFTSSAFTAVQATGAMAIVIADVPAVHSAEDLARALFTLSVLPGVVMLAAGFLRLGSVLRFVSNAVMVGFISAVRVNIILGQLANLAGYKAEGANSGVRAINTLIRPGELHLQSLAIEVLTIALILVLERTRAGPLGWCSRLSLPRLAWPCWAGVVSPQSGSSARFPARCRCPRPRCSGWFPRL